MVEWINDNKIFEQLYVQNTNSHLIQRSSDFLKFMLDEHLVTIEHMEMVWASARRNETEQKLAVYKVLKDVSSSLSKEHLDFLVDRVCEKEALQLTKDDVELLGDLTRYNYRYREEFCLRFSDFYWNLLLSAAKLP
jgi:ubiquitin carboxyl-terminal hydrolase 34